VSIACAVACGLAFAAPAMGMGPPALVRDINPGSGGSSIAYPASFDGRLYFSANTVTNGAELWSSDGTTAGTKLFKDIFPGSESSFPIGMTSALGELIFRAGDGLHGDEPWASDGTPAGTALVTDIAPGLDGSGPFGLALGDSRAYFQADDGTHGNELWTYGGAGTDTTPVTDLNSGVQGGVLAVGDMAYFGGDDGDGLRLWTSNGSPAGTEQVSDQPFVTVSGLVAMAGKAFFSGLTADGAELWVSDGTDAGTEMLGDIGPGMSSGLSLFAQAVELDGTVLFVADDGTGDKLWRTDGTPENTDPVADDVRPANGTLTVVDDVVYFAGGDDDTGRELWKTDGTEAGTEMVIDINGGAESSLPGLPERLTAIGDTLFFSADDGDHGYELWTSDGTEDGTKMVADIVDSSGGSFPSEITEAAGRVFFVAGTFAAGRELWSFEIDASPVAVGDSATVVEDAAATAIPVLANDTDADGGAPKSVASVTQPANGKVTIGGGGVTYEPDPDYCNAGGGTDDFAYELAPGGDVALVEVTVTCADDAPVAADDSATVAEDAAATAIRVLANDADIDGGAAKSVASVTQPANGEVVVTGGGSGLTYRPDAGYCNEGSPTDDFSYALSPGGDTAAVAVRVTCVDDPPKGPKRPGIVIANGTAKVARGVARLGVRCRGEGACKGRATLAVTVRRGKRTVRVALGSKRFEIAAGKTGTVRIQLNRAGRSRLAKSRSGRLRVKLAGSGVKPRTVVLKAD
jgi:ELWxxDGT repeat protein